MVVFPDESPPLLIEILEDIQKLLEGRKLGKSTAETEHRAGKQSKQEQERVIAETKRRSRQKLLSDMLNEAETALRDIISSALDELQELEQELALGSRSTRIGPNALVCKFFADNGLDAESARANDLTPEQWLERLQTALQVTSNFGRQATNLWTEISATTLVKQRLQEYQRDINTLDELILQWARPNDEKAQL